MDIRVLRYFLAVAREQSYSAAAERLYLSQPTLSRQLKELEEELGKPLLIRSNKGVTLTEDGMILRKRAEEIVELLDKAEQEVRQSDSHISGKVYIGAGETYAVRLIADTAKRMQAEYPDVTYSIYSADATDVMERLERGIIDFGIIFQSYDAAKYEGIEMPLRDRFGLLMRRDHPLAEKERIELDDLAELPLIVPKQRNHRELMLHRFGLDGSRIRTVAEYNLVYNGSVMAREGLGCCLCLDRLINVSGDSELCFRPLHPAVQVGCHFVWKRYTVFTKAAALFLERFRADLGAQTGSAP